MEGTPIRSAILLAPVALCLVAEAHGQAARPRTSLSGRWIGQDGHDLVGPSPTPGPDGVQDVRITVNGVPAARRIVGATITGLGGGEWTNNRPGNAWHTAIERRSGATTADLFFEPGKAETGRPFRVVLSLDDGRALTVDVRGGTSDPNRRMASAMMKAAWVGQNGTDRAGSGPGVGPDGFQDVQLQLTNLARNVPVDHVAITGPNRLEWRSGTNPRRRPGAEVHRPENDPATADVWFQPDRDLAGMALSVTVTYGDGRTDTARTAGTRTDPKLRVAAVPLPRIVPNSITARWLGQDGTNRVGPGDVRVGLSGLPRDRRIVAAALSNSARGIWGSRFGDGPFTAEPYALPLSLELDTAGTRADLRFPPDRDESGGILTLRLVLDDGSMTLVSFPGGPCDAGLRAGEGPAASSVEARPGDDLQALADRHGAIRLAAGTYDLDRPLTITRAVTIRGVPGSVLRFRQPAGSEPWTAAIKVRHGLTTLEGFAVRFAGPVRWREGINDGPAIIGTADNFDPPQRDLLAQICLIGLDLEAPPASGGAAWEPAPHLARLRGASTGRIEKNTLRGGPIEVWDGPWSFVGNSFRGTRSGTSSPSVITVHNGHDLVVKENTTIAASDAGKTWRFLVLIGSGVNVRVEDNRIEGVGPRDDDTIPSANAPEIVLTESYSIHFEGKPTAISPDGRILQIAEPQGEPARTGSAVAILEGPHAGTWHRVAHAIDPRTYLVDPPLPKGDYAVSLASGFVGMSLERNRIDARGGSVALPILLAGNHFGTRVIGNHLLGGGDAFRIVACPTERPCGWGWSRVPMLGLTIENNTIEDSPRGGLLAVEQNDKARTTLGRVYLTGTFRGNTAVYTRPPKAPARDVRVAFTLGEPAADPGAMVLENPGNLARFDGGTVPPVLRIASARINGRDARGQTVALREVPLR
jgi:hypothetical protein